MYLKEEVQAEALTRSLMNFSRFLETAALSNCEQIVFNSVANDAQLSARTVQDYFSILEDTLIGELLPPFKGTKKRKAMTSAKFYFFDIGIANALLNRFSSKIGTPEYSKAFEHLVYRELRSATAYLDIPGNLYYWRAQTKQEVDFILDTNDKAPIAIETKGKRNVSDNDLTGIRAFAEDFPRAHKIVVCNESVPRITKDNIHVWPIEYFVDKLWNKDLS
jgi:predicted AAA+ superfamily ATPase